MRWKGRQQSGNIEDRRGMGGGRLAVGGGAGILIVAALVWLLGGDPGEVLNTLSTTPMRSGIMSRTSWASWTGCRRSA